MLSTSSPISFPGKEIVIVGASKSAPDDYRRALGIWPNAIFIGINRVPMHLSCHAAFSVHPHTLSELYADTDTHLVSCMVSRNSKEHRRIRDAFPRIDTWVLKRPGLTSAPAAMEIMATFHVKHIALCGVSLDSGGYFFDTEAEPWTCPRMRQYTAEQLSMLKDELSVPVTGMSGLSQEIFGGPHGHE